MTKTGKIVPLSKAIEFLEDAVKLVEDYQKMREKYGLTDMQILKIEKQETSFNELAGMILDAEE